MKRATDVFTTINAAIGIPEGAPLPPFMQRVVPFTTFFKISKLQTMEPTEETIFGQEDFLHQVVSDDPALRDSNREPRILKMGSLLITFCAGGKASFELDVQTIDKEARQLRPLFHFNGERYPGFQFEDMMPFFLGGIDSTLIKRDPANPMLAPANQVRGLIERMAKNEPVPSEEAQAIITNFFVALEAYRNQQRQQPRAPIHQGGAASAPGFFGNRHEPDRRELARRDVSVFLASDEKPRDEVELAAKLAACFLKELGINKEQIKTIISEYCEETRQPFSAMNEAWIESVMTSLIDNERYCLKTVFPEDVSNELLAQVVEELKHAQEAAPRPS